MHTGTSYLLALRVSLAGQEAVRASVAGRAAVRHQAARALREREPAARAVNRLQASRHGALGTPLGAVSYLGRYRRLCFAMYQIEKPHNCCLLGMPTVGLLYCCTSRGGEKGQRRPADERCLHANGAEHFAGVGQENGGGDPLPFAVVFPQRHAKNASDMRGRDNNTTVRGERDLREQHKTRTIKRSSRHTRRDKTAVLPAQPRVTRQHKLTHNHLSRAMSLTSFHSSVGGHVRRHPQRNTNAHNTQVPRQKLRGGQCTFMLQGFILGYSCVTKKYIYSCASTTYS